MEREKQLTFIDEEGNEILCEILFTFESEEFKKNYVLFYPITEEDAEDLEVMAASYVPNENGEGELQPIETDEEWDLIEDVLSQFEEGDEFELADDEDDEEHDHDCNCGHKH